MVKSLKLVLICLAVVSTKAFAEEQKQAPKVTDAQIAAIVVAANSVDAEAGKFAKSKSKTNDIKAFAAQMETDHTAVNKTAVELVTKLKVKPEENDTSKALKKDGADNLANLKKLTGKGKEKEFDKAYVDHEVAYHKMVLDAIDQVLIPSAQNAELKALLEKVRPNIAAHLEHAEKIQSTLK